MPKRPHRSAILEENICQVAGFTQWRIILMARQHGGVADPRDRKFVVLALQQQSA